MATFVIQPHNRIQEWVAEEKGYFAEEGLDYEFVEVNDEARFRNPTIGSAEGAPEQVLHGAYEDMAQGRACNISAACHWAVNMAASGVHGRMWGHAYSVTPAGIFVPPDSPVREPKQLAGVEVAVGRHSGSHFSALQALENIMDQREISLNFVGGRMDRTKLLLDRRVEAANIFGPESYLLEQQGFCKVLDTSFMIGFLINGDPLEEDLHRYFNSLRRAQRDIDLEPERYKHYLLRELPAEFRPLLDVRRCGIGERLVFEPYTREMFEQTHRWMLAHDLFSPDEVGTRGYEAVMAI